jgi:hypothetical protein
MGAMPVLGVCHRLDDGRRVADLTWHDGDTVQMSVPFAPEFDRFDLEDVRWYHENYRESWGVSSDSVIRRIQRAERNIGELLHAALFHGPAEPVAARVRGAGADLRVEIRDEVHDAAIPWELVTDADAGEPLALTAASFVRTVGGGSQAAVEDVPRPEQRLLLLISRPYGGADVGYWSVAYGLWRELAALSQVKVDVLRPSTYDALERWLDEAARAGAPYTAVHFDGHGAVVDPFGGDRTRGYLVFETPGRAGPEFIDGSTLGRALAAAGVRLFSMNACRSADSEGGDRHLRVGPREPVAGQPSIVDDVLAAGVPACVGMRREIYAGTAVRFFEAFYPDFFGGAGAGAAARTARHRLREDPLSAGVFRAGSASVDDWSIPVVGERGVVHLRTEGADVAGSRPGQPFPERLSAPPVVGFDRVVLMLEDLLAEPSAVLVTGPLLSGKSRLAVEYARWLSATSPSPVPVTFVDLAAHGTPTALATQLVPDGTGSDPAGCAEHLTARGGLVILDQADRLAPETEAFLAELVPRLAGACRVVATSRAEHLSWLPQAPSVLPTALHSGARAELALRWAQTRGAPLDVGAFQPLLFFSGGFPGVLLTLLGTAHDAVTGGVAQARDISFWLHSADWEKVAGLSSDPGSGVRSIETLVDDVVGDLSSVCGPTELAMIRVYSRFQVCCDERAAARLWRLVSGAEAPAGGTARVIEKLVSSGLATPIVGAVEPSWFLHPLLKLVASRLPALQVDDDELQGAVIKAVSQTCAEALARFRSDVAGSYDTLANHKQNALDALYFALERQEQRAAAAALTEAVCVLCRFDGDTDLASRVLDRALLLFVDGRTGALRPECLEIGRRVWDQAVWISPYWPRNPRPMHGRMSLLPADDDHYAAGLWFRGLGDRERASVAFRMAADTPEPERRWAPGDLECQLSDAVYDPGRPATWQEALELAQESYAARLPDDSLGRAWSRITEARLRMVMTLNREAAMIGDEDIMVRIEIGPKQLAGLEEAAALLREADGEPGVQSAENRSQAAMVWSRIMLARGDLTSAISYFEDGAQVMIDQQEGSIWSHYWGFAINLLHHGWVARSYEMAVSAFQFAMQTGNHERATRIRQFCEQLEATYPELRDE